MVAVDKNRGGIMTVPLGLLAGFSFSAALQVIGLKTDHRGVGFAAFLLFVATVLFMLTLMAFMRVNNSVAGADWNLRSTFHYEVELGLATVSIILFLAGTVAAGWVRSTRLGVSLLVLIIAFAGIFVVWTVLGPPIVPSLPSR